MIRRSGIPVLVLVLELGCHARHFGAGGPPREPDQVADVRQAEDLYYYRGKAVPLERSRRELVVGFITADEGRTRAIVSSVSSLATLSGPVVVSARPFHIVGVPGTPAGPSIEEVATKLRAMGDVALVAPVFYHPESRRRMVATDEILVKVKVGTAGSLAATAAARGLVVVRTLRGTTDEYVLRLADPKNAEALAVARRLFESGQFEWVEPNFHQEFENFGGPL